MDAKTPTHAHAHAPPPHCPYPYPWPRPCLCNACGCVHIQADDLEGQTTFNLSLLHNVMKRIPNFVPKIIDLMLIGEAFAVVSKAAPQQPLVSDHIPLLATLKLRS